MVVVQNVEGHSELLVRLFEMICVSWRLVQSDFLPSSGAYFSPRKSTTWQSNAMAYCAPGLGRELIILPIGRPFALSAASARVVSRLSTTYYKAMKAIPTP